MMVAGLITVIISVLPQYLLPGTGLMTRLSATNTIITNPELLRPQQFIVILTFYFPFFFNIPIVCTSELISTREKLYNATQKLYIYNVDIDSSLHLKYKWIHFKSFKTFLAWFRSWYLKFIFILKSQPWLSLIIKKNSTFFWLVLVVWFVEC